MEQKTIIRNLVACVANDANVTRPSGIQLLEKLRMLNV